MVILMFSLGFVALFLLTRSYMFIDRYYSTIQYVSGLALLYVLICRGYMLWRFSPWWIITGKVSILLQVFFLFPSTTVLFLRYLPQRSWTKFFYFIGFLGIYVGMEGLLVLTHEITYAHGWKFGWSIFIDFLLFTMMWIHSKSWKVALPISAGVVVFLVTWFRVPLSG